MQSAGCSVVPLVVVDLEARNASVSNSGVTGARETHMEVGSMRDLGFVIVALQVSIENTSRNPANWRPRAALRQAVANQSGRSQARARGCEHQQEPVAPADAAMGVCRNALTSSPLAAQACRRGSSHLHETDRCGPLGDEHNRGPGRGKPGKGDRSGHDLEHQHGSTIRACSLALRKSKAVEARSSSKDVKSVSTYAAYG
ncbi:hypothetical protein KFL_002070050 [Klebsormidium nitens]|uniref:Uncharacterized protein n=1 Tax=Klebsormidium nitens TaxID=105231 RepID=A0A1Y1I5X4_KLENI|nr:hypothetical protein KFL_002070050 [Klebsormidium nitens]|eukprot:GAQ84809.1 hypothetical protein KFL_002070050 [Klebsormidium nitens]